MYSSNETRITITNRRARLFDVRAEGTENYTRDALRVQNEEYLALINQDRVGRILPTITESETLINISNDLQLETINQSLDTVISTNNDSTEIALTIVSNNANAILNESGIINRIMYYLVQLRELPLMQRIILSGGIIIVIIGGVYIAYKVIQKTTRVTTIITPFGAIRDENLTMFGRTIKRIGRVINNFSIQK